ncbi:patched domain-containing protein 3-like [Symsagittifera roscoffensis]|uniref:patched domain-containing protein 3-like n=1 Tax=Symsagittifera roscoffensis TaxID=84072 RepID=UPI00307C1FEA
MDESVYNVQYSWTHQFYEEHNESSSKEKFFTVLLPKFLKKYPNFERDIVIERRNNDSKAIGIITSRFFVPSKFLDGIRHPEEAKRRLGLLEQVQQIHLNTSGLTVKVVGSVLKGWESMFAVKESTWRTVAGAMAMCSLLVFFIIPEMSVWVAVVSTTSLAVLCTLGLMSGLGLQYNMLSYTQILISIGLCIDYMSHSGYSFSVEEGTPLERSQKALQAMGVALTNAALSSLTGVMFLSLSSVYAFHSCFLSFLALFLLSTHFGVLFLPTLLSFIGPSSSPSSSSSTSSSTSSSSFLVSSSESNVNLPGNSGILSFE